MQSEASYRKRKACLTCTRAKAKCTPNDQLTDAKCQRCLRLNKDCVYEDGYKKPGPKTRSRVKQLEQRVESLIDLITANNGNQTTASQDKGYTSQAPKAAVPLQPTPPISDSSPSVATDSAKSQPTPIGPLEVTVYEPYDPIEVGVISEQHADKIVEEFKTSFVLTFPFVVLDEHATASTMRREQPFLLHAILAVAAYESPRLQCILGDEFRRQIARTVECASKSLEILQGVMIYAAWYHTFYQPRSQQMSFVVQMCVALVQDLGYDFNRRHKTVLSSRMQFQGNMLTDTEDMMASKRAFLGTYALCTSFAQAWRKRPSLSYTRYMAQCCESFKQSPIQTDALIPPNIQLCELWSRVNDHFSYDNIEYTDIHGELMLSMSTTTFRREVQRVRDSVMQIPIAEKNTTLNLMFSALEIQIDECCIHSSLWRTEADAPTIPPTLVRLSMFDRTLRATMVYLQMLQDLETRAMFRLSTQTWTAWFHIVIVICKLVFVRDNERLDDTPIEDLPAELSNILPNHEQEERELQPPFRQHGPVSSWEPLDIARQYNIQARFERFMNKLRFSLPADTSPWSIVREERDSLHSIACIQHLSLNGFSKALKKFHSMPQPNVSTSQTYSAVDAENAEVIQRVTGQTHSNPVMAAFRDGQMTHPTVQGSMPFASFLDFGTINFDGITMPPQNAVQQEHVDDWMWSTIMDDFSMPTW